MKFKKVEKPDYSEGIGKTNISKVNGTINKEKWESALLKNQEITSTSGIFV